MHLYLSKGRFLREIDQSFSTELANGWFFPFLQMCMLTLKHKRFESCRQYKKTGDPHEFRHW